MSEAPATRPAPAPAEAGLSAGAKAHPEAPASAPSQLRQTRRVLLWAALLAGVPGLLLVLMTALSMRATDLQRVGAAYPAFERAAGRKSPPAQRCGLNQLPTPQGCKAAVPSSVLTEDVTFESSIPQKGLKQLAGTISLPQGIEGKRPALVLVHGSGPLDRHLTVPGDLVRKLSDNFAVFDALAAWLANQGFIVLSYDKRSCGRCYGASSFKPELFSFQDFETDAVDALKYLASRSDVAAQRLVVVGVSQGGGFAPFIANQLPQVAAMVSLSGLFEGFDVALLAQLDRISAIRKDQWDYFGPLNIFLQRSKFSNCFSKLTGPKYVADEVCIGGGVTQRALKAYAARSATAPSELKAVKVPMFLSQGTLDRNVSPQLFDDLSHQLAGHDAEFHFIAGMDHAQTDVSNPKPVLHPALLAALKAFFASVPLSAAQ